MADVATLFPDQYAPSAESVASPGSAGHADAEPPTRAESGETEPAKDETPEPAKEKPAPAPKAEKAEAPAAIFTKAEVDALIADATKRQRADQSATARENAELTRRLTAREQAFAELVQRYQGTQVEGDALRSWMQSENSAQDAAAAEERTQQESARVAASLARDKAAVAGTLYQEQYGPLLYEAGQLGIPQAELVAKIDAVLASADFKPFHEAFNGARSVEDAQRVAKPGYVLMAKEVRAQLQQTKLDSLKEPEPANPNPKPERVQVHGAGGAGVDPLGHLPIGQRGAARLRAGIAADATRLFNTET